jgi:hypothetical protein
MEPHHKRDSSRVSVIRKDDRHGLVLKGIVEGIKYALNTFTSTKGITRCQGVAFPFMRLLFCGTDIAVYMKRSARIPACDHIRVKRCAICDYKCGSALLGRSGTTEMIYPTKDMLGEIYCIDWEK